MPTNTYVALDSVTVGTATPSITFTGINQGYTDLVLVVNATPTTSGGIDLYLTVNGDTTSGLYSKTHLAGSGTSAGSTRFTGQNRIATFWQVGPQNTQPFLVNYSLQNYSNSSVFKTVLARAGAFQGSASEVNAFVGLWRNTNAITSVTLTASSGNFAVGSNFSLYGIAATGAGAKATGGVIYSDSQYYYHAFAASGTFTPTQSITADCLVIAGGGGGAHGGGGAGGLLAFTGQSLTATGYTVTVGGGGAGGSGTTKGTNGVDSQFGGLTLVKGGGGAGVGGTFTPLRNDGLTGGSGGGGAPSGASAGAGGSATSGQGFAGGNAGTGAGTYPGGGGGGAGAVGAVGVNATGGGAGGIGSSTYSSWGTATGFGQNVSGTVYFAGGGGGGSDSGAGAGGLGGGGAGAALTATAGAANTGGGAGGSSNNAGVAGGSGIVIVRYAK